MKVEKGRQKFISLRFVVLAYNFSFLLPISHSDMYVYQRELSSHKSEEVIVVILVELKLELEIARLASLICSFLSLPVRTHFIIKILIMTVEQHQLALLLLHVRKVPLSFC